MSKLSSLLIEPIKLGKVVSFVFELPFSRAQETEADEVWPSKKTSWHTHLDPFMTLWSQQKRQADTDTTRIKDTLKPHLDLRSAFSLLPRRVSMWGKPRHSGDWWNWLRRYTFDNKRANLNEEGHPNSCTGPNGGGYWSRVCLYPPCSPHQVSKKYQK